MEKRREVSLSLSFSLSPPPSLSKINKLKEKTFFKGKTENLNRPITNKNVEKVIKILPKNKSSGLDDLTGEF